MAKTGSERQREYLRRVREERLRLDVWLDHRALLALARGLRTITGSRRRRWANDS